MSPLISQLPDYAGPHQVGTVDLEADVNRRLIHEAKFKEDGERAFELETVFVTLYYPTSRRALSTTAAAQHPWVPRPISLTGMGYARLARVPFLEPVFTFFLWLLVGSTKISGHVDAPVLAATPLTFKDASVVESASVESFESTVSGRSNTEDVEDSFPVVVFSHGMAGMRTSYSHYLGSLASQGYVVAAIEHRDGSGPGTIIRSSDGKQKKLYHFGLKDVIHDPPMTSDQFKAAQLAFREAEVVETIKLLSALNSGAGSALQSKNPHHEGLYLHIFRNRLSLPNITIAGHSYGATLAMQTLRDAPSKDLPLNGGIILDPGKQSGPLNSEINVPLLIINTNSWTTRPSLFYGKPHFEVVRDIVCSIDARSVAGWFMTLKGTSHPSSTDAPLIAPGIMRLATGTTLGGAEALKEYVEASADFLGFLRDGVKRGVLGEEVTDPEGRVEEGKGNWAVHVSPGS